MAKAAATNARGPKTLTKGATSVDPTHLYALEHFKRVAGISDKRLGAAKRAGRPIPAFEWGGRKWVDGADGIAWIKANCTKRG